MVVDKRHDHSFRVPRPDLSDKLRDEQRLQRLPQGQDLLHGRPRRSKAGSGLSGKGCRTTARPSMRRGTTAPARRSCLPPSPRTPTRRPSPAPARSPSSRLRLSGECRPGAEGPLRSRPDGAHRRARHARRRAAGSALAVRLAAPLRSDPRRAHAGGVAARGRRRRSTVGEPIASGSTARRRSFIAAQALNADRPEARATLGSFYARRGETAEAEAEYQGGAAA